METNDQLVLICGLSGTGKTASLRNIRNQERWAYLNCEAGKKPPFRNKFLNFRVDDPGQVLDVFDEATANPDKIDGIIIDSITFLMDMFESKRVLPSANRLAAWSDYNQYFKAIFQDKVIKFGKPVIVIAHVTDVLDEKAMEWKTYVPVKGALKNQGVEAYFSCVVSAKKKPLKDLKAMDPKLCRIAPEDEEIGYKYVFQTRPTKDTLGERIRSPMGLFSKETTYIDNDAQLLLDFLNDFYAKEEK